jgi:hypothetical protein
LWGYYGNGNVWHGNSSWDKRNFWSDENYCKSGDWDKAHQPTHIMLRTDDIKPEPPEIEPSLYEQVKAICEGKGMVPEVESFKNIGQWGRRAHELHEKHHDFYWDVAEQVSSLFSNDSALAYCCLSNEAVAYWYCEIALKLAKEQE